MCLDCADAYARQQVEAERASEMLETIKELLGVLDYWWGEEVLSGADTFDPMQRARALLREIGGKP